MAKIAPNSISECNEKRSSHQPVKTMIFWWKM